MIINKKRRKSSAHVAEPKHHMREKLKVSYPRCWSHWFTDQVSYLNLFATISIIETDPVQPISSTQNQVKWLTSCPLHEGWKTLLTQNWDSMAQDVGRMSSQLLGGVKDNLIFSFTSDTEIGNWRKYHTPHPPVS